MKHKCFLSIAAFWAWQGLAMELKYEDLPALVRQKNGAVTASEQSVQAAESRTGHYGRSLLPHIDLVAGGEHFRTGPYPTDTQPYGGIELTLNVFRGGRDLLEEEHRKAQLSGVAAEKERVFREELAFARSDYWELLFHREWRVILQRFLKRNEEGGRAAARRRARGLISDTDVLSFELYDQQLKEQIASSEHECELLQIALRPRLGWEEKTPVDTSTVIPHDHDEVLVQAEGDMRSSPEIQALSARAASASSQARGHSRWWLPAVDLYGTYSLYTLRERFYPKLQDRFDIAAGIRLRMHVFDGLEGPREAESGFRAAAAAEALALYRRQMQRTDVKLAQEEMRHIHELIHGAEGFLEKGQRLLSQSLSEYDRGVRTSQDILSMSDRMLTLQKLHLERRRDYQKSKMKLLGLLGK